MKSQIISEKFFDLRYHLSLFAVNRLITRVLIGDKYISGLSLLVTFFGIFSLFFDVTRLQSVRMEAPNWLNSATLLVE